MPIRLQPYEDLAALAVFQTLEPWDHREAEVTRAAAASPLSLWADWRAMQPACALSLVAVTGDRPFAVLALGNTGQGGVGQVALLARSHARFRRPLRELVARIRRGLPDECRARGIHRLEARCWDAHPTAAHLLTLIGFRHECRMPGFGLGQHDFHQFAWTLSAAPDQTPKGQ